jgi:hypothetical protein
MGNESSKSGYVEPSGKMPKVVGWIAKNGESLPVALNQLQSMRVNEWTRLELGTGVLAGTIVCQTRKSATAEWNTYAVPMSAVVLELKY